MMRYVTDAHCALPDEWLVRHAIAVVPSVLRFGDAELVDRRIDAECAAFAERLRRPRRPDVRQLAMPWAALAAHLGRCADDNAPVLAVVVADVWGVAPPVAWRRVLAGRWAERQFGIITCGRAGTAQGLVLADAVYGAASAVDSRAPLASIRQPLRERLRTLLVPGDRSESFGAALAPLRRAGSGDGDVVNMLLRKTPLLELYDDKFRLQRWFARETEAWARALSIACVAVQKGLDPPVVVMSYAGELASVASGDAYANLLRTCSEHGVVCLMSCMSMTQSLRFGAGAFELSFAARRRGARS